MATLDDMLKCCAEMKDLKIKLYHNSFQLKEGAVLVVNKFGMRNQYYSHIFGEWIRMMDRNPWIMGVLNLFYDHYVPESGRVNRMIREHLEEIDNRYLNSQKKYHN